MNNNASPFRIGQRVWFFKNDGPFAELESKPILDMSVKGNIAISRMKDLRPNYQKRTTFFCNEHDAIVFMLSILVREIEEAKTTFQRHQTKIRELDTRRHQL